MVIDRPRIRSRGGKGDPIRLSGEKALGINAVVPDRSLVTQKVDVQLVGEKQAIQGSRKLAHRAIPELHDRHQGGVIIKVLPVLATVSGHLDDLFPFQIPG